MKNKKYYLSLFITSLLLVMQTWLAGAQNSTPRIWLSSEVAEVTAGQEFNVTVNVSGAEQVYGGSFQLLYDAQAFEVVLDQNKAVTPGAFFGSAPNFPLKNSADATTGTIDYALTLTQPAQPVSGDGVLGTVRFRALTDATFDILPVKASLVSPEFTEVDGRLIAQKINQIEAEIAETTLVDGTTLALEASQLQPTAAPSVNTDTSVASASVGAISQQNETITSETVMTRQPNNRVLIVAGLFFFAGLVLLIISVGMYSKMRMRFSFAVDHLPERPL